MLKQVNCLAGQKINNMPKKISEIDDIEGNEFHHYFETIKTGNDHICAIVAASFLEQCVYAMLKKYLIHGSTSERILKSNGFLGSFRNATDISYCLGLTHKDTHSNLVLIGDIRNEFAHNHLAITFKSQSIVQLCNNLKTPPRLIAEKYTTEFIEQLRAESHSRLFFSAVATCVAGEIINKAKTINQLSTPP